MQSYPGRTKALRCVDCKSDFPSAATILQHFANHASGKGENNELVDLFCEIMSRLHHCSPAYIRKKFKLKASSEQSLKHSVYTSSTTHRACHAQGWVECSSRASSTGDTIMEDNVVCDSSQMSEGKEADSVPISHILTEIGVRAKNRRQNLSVSSDIMLVECSLQGRLENCIVKLSSRQKNLTPAPCKNLSSDRILTPAHLTQPKQFSHRLPNSSKLNPVNLCFLTTNGIAGHLGVPQAKAKSASCRKQASPRKVVHHRANVSRRDGSVHVDGRGVSEECRRDTPQCKVETMEAVGGRVLSDLDGVDGKVVSGKKKYPCHLCTKTFGWSTDLKRHILTHTGERPFKCGLCQATFTRNFLLQKHEAKFHNMKPPVAVSRNSLGARHSGAVENGTSSAQQRMLQYKQCVARKLDSKVDHKNTELLKLSKPKSISALRSNLCKKGTGSQAKSILPSKMSSP